MAKKQEDRFVKHDNGEMAKATFPIVMSAIRSTDIPAFYYCCPIKFFEDIKI